MVNVDSKNAAVAAVAVRNGDHLPGPATVRRSPTLGKLAEGLVKVQSAIDDPKKNRKADAGAKQYRYADLPTVLDAIREALPDTGLAFLQLPCELDGQPAVMTLLTHTSGEFVETIALLRPQQAGPQAVGSALSYARRYALLSLFGIAAEDDDGKAAMPPQRPPAAAAPPAKAHPDDRQRVGRFAQDIAQAEDLAALKGAGVAIKLDYESGLLSDDGRKHLLGLYEQRKEELAGAAA